MKKSTKIILVVLGLVILYCIFGYNRLVTSNENVDNQWAQVETQYQRRFDLIPNLVESVKGIMKQEQTIFNTLAEARTRYSGAGSNNAKALAAGEVEGALARLLVVMENYPVLKSSDNVQTLMAQLEGTENRVAVERKRYNDEVRSHNLNVIRFPMNMLARTFGYGERNYFESAEEASQSPEVKI